MAPKKTKRKTTTDADPKKDKTSKKPKHDSKTPVGSAEDKTARKPRHTPKKEESGSTEEEAAAKDGSRPATTSFSPSDLADLADLAEETQDFSKAGDYLIGKFTAKQLQQNGYIDYLEREKPNFPEMSAVFKPGPQNTTTDPLHSLFERKQWQGTDDKLWQTLQPSLQLATRFLDEVLMHHYFSSLIRGPHEQMPHPELTKVLGRRPRKFGHLEKKDLMAMGGKKGKGGGVAKKSQKGKKGGKGEDKDDSIRFHDYDETRKEIVKMSKKITWRWDDYFEAGPATYAQTDRDEKQPGLNEEDGASGSTIKLNRIFRNALLNNGGCDSVLLAIDNKFGREEASLRARLVLAITIVHEICHALSFATRNQSDVESFYRDHRIAEMGFAFESLLFDGAMSSISAFEEVGVTCGLLIQRWPGAFDGERIQVQADDSKTKAHADGQETADQETGDKESGPLLELKSAMDAEKHYHTRYLVLMTWVRQFFTDRFWNGKKPQHGLSAYHPERRVGFRLYIDGVDEDAAVEHSPAPMETELPPER